MPMPRGGTLAAVAAAVAVVVLLGGCGPARTPLVRAQPARPAAPLTFPPDPAELRCPRPSWDLKWSTVATVHGPSIPVFASPGGSTRTTLSNPNERGVPRVFL